MTERMDPRRLEEQLQRKESEASQLRRNLRELRAKFQQLERAFEINLQSQVYLEVELNRVQLESEGRLQHKYFFFLSFLLLRCVCSKNFSHTAPGIVVSPPPLSLFFALYC